VPSEERPKKEEREREVVALNDNSHIGATGIPLRRPWPERKRVGLTNGAHIPPLLHPPRNFACRLHSDGAAGSVGSPAWQRQPLKNLDFLDLSNRTCRGLPASGSLRGCCGGATRRRATSGGALAPSTVAKRDHLPEPIATCQMGGFLQYSCTVYFSTTY
jgi:hypothetical protein